MRRLSGLCRATKRTSFTPLCRRSTAIALPSVAAGGSGGWRMPAIRLPFSTASTTATAGSTPAPPAHLEFKRDARFATITASDVSALTAIVGGESGVITDAAGIEPYNRDWMKKWKGECKLVLRPATTDQLARALAYCNQRKLAVVPQGGNTGLVGGSIPIFDEIVISTSRMNRIISFDENSGILVCEAGCILEVLNDELDKRGFMMPLDLGAKGSCQIGGNVSTNAGGTRLVRYGSLRGTVLGLEIVLADGTVLDHLTTLRKDNTGYDLKQLFIGAEGTLGMVTKVSILTARKPKAVTVAFLGLNSYDDVLKTLQKARTDLGEILSAIEFLDRASLELVTRHIPNTRDPLSGPAPLYVLIEVAGSDREHDTVKLNRFLESCMESSLIADGTIAQDTAQAKHLWSLRESVAEALTKHGAVYKYDISIPVTQMYEFVTDMRTRLGDAALVVGYGHLGDGNLHLNVSTPKYDKTVFGLIEPYLFQRTAAVRGSVSAEHGLGQAKPQYLQYSKPAPLIALMRQIKSLLDPNGILNPYKMLPPK